MADDLGYGELGCYGQRWIQTPHLDRLAAEGMRLTQFYAGQAVCAPSRCVLMTGKHAGHAAIRDNGNPRGLDAERERYGWEFPGQFPLPAEEVTLGELFQAHGYATAAIGKWGLGHVGTAGDPSQQGFDLFYGFIDQIHAHNHYPRFLWRNGAKETLPGNQRTLTGETYSQDRFIEEALHFLRENAERPFFLYLPFAIPHLSIQVPDASVRPYLDVIPEEDYEHRGYLRHPTPRAGYAGMVTHMDRGVGEILDELDALKVTQNTLVIFTSDNGPAYRRLGGADSEFFESTAGLRGRKGSLYEGGLRVPFIARWPDEIPAGSTRDVAGAAWDVLPTACELLATEPPEGVDGQSLLALLRGDEPEPASPPRHFYWEFPGYEGQRALRFGSWKAITTKMHKGNRKLALYNLAVDRNETTDVAAEHPAVLRQLQVLMDTARRPSPMFPFPALDDAAK